jgi:very-short-patch-repair endonuclease
VEQPITNYPIGRYRADFAWPNHKLVVEFDSWSAHGHKQAFKHDRRRNRWLAAQGWLVVPVTWDDLTKQPIATAAEIASALALRAPAIA